MHSARPLAVDHGLRHPSRAGRVPECMINSGRRTSGAEPAHRVDVPVVGAAAAAEHPQRRHDGPAGPGTASARSIGSPLSSVSASSSSAWLSLDALARTPPNRDAHAGAAVEDVSEVRRVRAVDHVVRRIRIRRRVDGRDRVPELLSGRQAPVGLHGERQHDRHPDRPRRLRDPDGLLGVRHRDRGDQVGLGGGERPGLHARGTREPRRRSSSRRPGSRRLVDRCSR